MTPWFDELGRKVPEVYVSVSFPVTGARSGKRIGECHYTSKDGRPHLLIHPYLDEPTEVLATLLHEMVHAVVGSDAGHKAPFKRLAEALGLTGKMTATVATDELRGTLADMVRRGLGPYPHAALQRYTPKQSTRQLKVVCPNDHGEKAYVVRMTRKWLDEVGPPICPCGTKMEEEVV